MSPHFAAHLLEIQAGGFCSEHRHARKRNHFHVIQGELEILSWPDGKEPDRTRLGPGDEAVVEPGIWHQFRALAPTIALEIYEAAPVEEDIDRRTTGGRC